MTDLTACPICEDAPTPPERIAEELWRCSDRQPRGCERPPNQGGRPGTAQSPVVGEAHHNDQPERRAAKRGRRI